MSEPTSAAEPTAEPAGVATEPAAAAASPAAAEPAAADPAGTTTDPAQPDPAAPAEPATGSDWATEVERLKAEATKWQTLSRKNEQRAKENAAKASKLDEIEEANKTELQRLNDRAAKAETALVQAQMAALRAEKSASTGVPIAVIPSGSEDEMDAAITAFQGALATALKSRPATPAAAPAGVVTATPDSTKVKQITSRAELQSMSHQDILEAAKNGRLDELMGRNS